MWVISLIYPTANFGYKYPCISLRKMASRGTRYASSNCPETWALKSLAEIGACVRGNSSKSIAYFCSVHWRLNRSDLPLSHDFYLTHGNVIFDILEPQVCPKTVNFAITVMILILIWFRFWFWLCGPTLCFQFCNRSWHNILSQYDLYRRHPWLLYHCVVAATHILGIINIIE